MENPVRDNPQRNRFELEVDGETAFASYRRSDGTLTILHTEVPDALQGRGHGARLVKGMLDIMQAQGLKVVPLCSFVRVYIDRHPEYAELLK